MTAIRSVAALQREPALLAGFDDGRVAVIAEDVCRVVCTLSASVESVAVTADESQLIACDASGAVEYRSLADGKPAVALSWMNRI